MSSGVISGRLGQETMKLPILLAAAFSLGTPVMAADLGVLTSLDVCDTLGLTGMTVSSDTACLQISGETYYEFHWGDYKGDLPVLANANLGTIDWSDSDGGATDWDSWIDTYLTLVGTSPSDFGPAKAVIGIYGYDYQEAQNGVLAPDQALELEQAYVSIGDTTILTAGLVYTSVFNEDDDESFGWLPSFMSDDPEGVAYGVGGGTYGIEGHVVQLTHNFGNGFTIGAGLEDLNADGSLVGVVNYAGDQLSAHVSVLAGGVLDGEFDSYALHTGLTAVFDNIKLRGALAANDSGWWNALASAEATLDLFTLAATVDASSESEFGVTGSGEAKLNEQWTIKVAARYVDPDTGLIDNEGLEVRGRLEFAATEQLTLGAEAGHLWTGLNAPSGTQSITDGALDLTWNPGGDFEATTTIAANTLGAYKLSFTASKTFQ